MKSHRMMSDAISPLPSGEGVRAASRLILVATVAVFLPSCKVGPNYAPPQTKTSDAWATQDEAGIKVGVKPVTQWWRTLNDPALDSLIDRAAMQNLDVKLAAARVREVRAQRGIVAADRWPTVNAGGQYQRERISQEVLGESGGTFSGPGQGRGLEFDFYQLGFDASWEMDLFGGVARSVEAADADIGAAIESQRDVLITLLSEVARTYVDLRSFQRRLEIAHKNIAAQQESLDLSTSRFNAGLVSELDVAQARANLANTQSQVPTLETGTRQSMYAIALLLGQEPSTLVSELDTVTPIPGVPTEVPIGLPSDLLRRRPDIRHAERQLAATTARIGVATSDLFPKFSLTGSLGLSSTKATNLFDAASSHFWSFGPTASWPIFDAGRIRANIRVTNAREEQASIEYEKAVLTSLGDVESALIAWWKEQIRNHSLAQAVQANQLAVELSNQLYQRGLTTFLNVLDSQRDHYAAEDQLVQSDRAVVANLIALYKALGGGWEAFEPAPEAAVAKADQTEKPIAARQSP